MKYPDIGRVSGYAGELRAALRRRNQSRRPRVRVRIGHHEPRILDSEAPEATRILELAKQLAAGDRGDRGGVRGD